MNKTLKLENLNNSEDYLNSISYLMGTDMDNTMIKSPYLRTIINEQVFIGNVVTYIQYGEKLQNEVVISFDLEEQETTTYRDIQKKFDPQVYLEFMPKILEELAIRPCESVNRMWRNLQKVGFLHQYGECMYILREMRRLDLIKMEKVLCGRQFYFNLSITKEGLNAIFTPTEKE
jgi:hypothetical protein